MSLEQQIEKLNENIRILIDVMSNTDKAPVKNKTTAKPKANKAEPKKETAKTKKMNYDKDVKPQVLIAISTPEGRSSIVELLEEYEVKNAKLLDAELYPAFLVKVAEIIEENDE